MTVRKIQVARRPRPTTEIRGRLRLPDEVGVGILLEHAPDVPVSAGSLDIVDRYIDHKIGLETMIRELRAWAATYAPWPEDEL